MRGTLSRFAVVFTAAFVATMAVCTSIRADAEPPLALALRTAGDDSVTRIVMEFDRPVEFTHRLLAHPWRLVLDFPKIGYGFDGDRDHASGIVSRLRFGDMSEEHSRLIFETDSPFVVKGMEARPDEHGGSKLVIDIEAASNEAFAAALEESVDADAVVNADQKQARLGPAVRQGDKPFTIVIDAGHGGIDNGAIGTRGTKEKDVTLAFAKSLREELQKYSRARVFLTRDSDVFVALDDRSGFARQHQADLFVSIHADSLRQHDVRGATVYTISDKASDSVAAQIARDQNLADSVAGVTLPDESGGVSDILIDLARRETLGFSVQFARLVINDMKGFARLINNPHRHAGFRVLKAPDVPSVLLELGYLSNPKDEALMIDEEWRNDLAARLADAIEKFAALSSRDIAAAPMEN